MSLEERVQNLKCLQPTHDEKPLIIVCLSKDCKSDRKLCTQCIEEFHADHKDQLVLIHKLEEYIKQNSIQLKGSVPALDILKNFDTFKKSLYSRVNFIEEILKEKVKLLFGVINSTDGLLQFQECEEELLLKELNHKTNKWLADNQETLINQVNQFLELVKPFQYQVNRLTQLDTIAHVIAENELHAIQFNVLVPGLKLAQVFQPLILDEAIEGGNERNKQPKLTYTIYESDQLENQIADFQITIDHQTMVKDDHYIINFPESIELKQNHTYTVTVKSDSVAKFEKWKVTALDGISNIQIGYALRFAEKIQNPNVKFASDNGLFPALVLKLA